MGACGQGAGEGVWEKRMKRSRRDGGGVVARLPRRLQRRQPGAGSGAGKHLHLHSSLRSSSELACVQLHLGAQDRAPGPASSPPSFQPGGLLIDSPAGTIPMAAARHQSGTLPTCHRDPGMSLVCSILCARQFVAASPPQHHQDSWSCAPCTVQQDEAIQL